jgi:diadenosine tetraphosphatase ApaH/serine/threonine PP2A family protein phosphatase
MNLVISAAIFVFWQDICFYHHSGSLTEFNKVPVSYLLQWEAIKEAKAKGIPNTLKPLYGEKAELYSQLSEEDIEYLVSLPLWINLENNWVVTHGGFTPHPLDKQNVNCMYIRYIDPITLKHKALGEDYSQPANTVFWDSLWNQNFNVIYGHSVFSLETPKIAVSKTTGKLCVGIDTGCCFGARLTAMILHDEFNFNFSQVQAKLEYTKRKFAAYIYNEACKKVNKSNFLMENFKIIRNGIENIDYVNLFIYFLIYPLLFINKYILNFILNSLINVVAKFIAPKPERETKTYRH